MHNQLSPFRIGHVSLPIRRLATWQRAVFLINSRLGLFTETILLVPLLPKIRGHRRYGAILPSSLGRFNSRALEYSSRIPVSVCGTGILEISRINFPGTSHCQSLSAVASRSPATSIALDRDVHHPDDIHSFVNIRFNRIGLLTYCASTTPYGLALAPD